MNPLIEAIKNNNPNQLKLLIELGYDMNVKDEYGDTLLHLAAARNAVDCAKVSIGKGMDLRITIHNLYVGRVI